MNRNVRAVLAGLLAGFAIIVLAETIGHKVYPPPSGISMRSLKTMVHGMPAGAFAFVLGGWLLGAGVGSWVAMRVSKSADLQPGIVVGLILLAATAYNLATIPHPTWVVITAVTGIPFLTWFGAIRGRAVASE